MSKALKIELVEICELLYVRGLAKAWGGNVSVRKGKNHIVITPRGRRGKKPPVFQIIAIVEWQQDFLGGS